MDREQAKNVLSNIELIKAFVAGKTIQCRQNSSANWVDVNSPHFSVENTRYRVKPTLFSCNVVVYAICRFTDGQVFTRKSLKAANRFADDQRRRGFTVRVEKLTKTVMP